MSNKEPIQTSLRNLSADMYGEEVTLSVMVSGQSNPKNIPQLLRVVPSEGDPIDVRLDQEKNYQLLRDYLFAQKRKVKEDLIPIVGSWGQGYSYNQSEERSNYQILLCRDLPGEEKFDEAIYSTIPVHLVNQKLPATRRIRIRGRVVDDRNNDLTILAYSAQPIEERLNVNFSEEDHQAFRRHFRENRELERDIDRSICPLIVGRPEAKLGTALTLCSPASFKFEGEIVRGNLHTLFLGATTTGKSRIMEWIRDVLRLGEYGTGDMSTYAGLGAAVDTDKDIIIWGLLPMADRELALIDSFQKVNPEDLPMFREALRGERLVVRKKVSGEAACRTRILVAANPNKPLNAYVNSAEALLDMRCMYDPVDLTRWDLFVRFHEKDVEDEKIAKAHVSEPRIPAEIMRKFVLWCWSLHPEQIIFTPEAEREVRKMFLKFSKLHCPDLPLIHKGYKEVIARVSAAFATLNYSVEMQPHATSAAGEVTRNKKITQKNTPTKSPAALVSSGSVYVLPKHVEMAANYLEKLIRAWEYEDLVLRIKGETELNETEVDLIATALKEDLTARQIFDEVARRQGTEAGALASKLDVAKSTIIRAAGRLKGLELIDSKERRPGYWLTPKGVAYVRKGKEQQKLGEFGKVEDLEEESSPFAKCAYCDRPHVVTAKNGTRLCKKHAEDYPGDL